VAYLLRFNFKRKLVYCLHQPLYRLLFSPPSTVNLCDEYGNGLKPAVVQHTIRHMEYADKSEGMTDSALADACGNGRKIASSPSGDFTTEQFYFPHFLWFKIISSKFHTCLGQGPNAKRGGGAGCRDHTGPTTARGRPAPYQSTDPT
jgi:hypothetical protein